ncbi:glycosyltransferase family 4 protein [Bdellovibrio sp. KM01]|uniref:glycosyltransferase family 4 protein n=1 Tax=Bdellovibrio sp. KM01 TaxID=2748865 RepID=UPI0015EABA9F|nr:glycosyltransferase family 4 protein [Bdellovibrio sp. KM01]QLY27039.1 glycosyltransferase family 4 protein [Bdellovibrio sp. KM01]
MNIAIVSLDNSDRILAGGKHVHQQLLKKALQKQGHSVFMIFPKRTLVFLVGRIILAILTKLHLLNRSFSYTWTLKCYCKSLSRQLMLVSQEINVVFAQDPVSAVAAGHVLTNAVPMVMTLHGYLARESVNYGNYSADEQKKVTKEALWYERESLKFARRVITVDSKIKSYLSEFFDSQKPVTVLKNAVNPELFRLLDSNSSKILKNELGLPENKEIVLVPRRLVRKNGVDIAIRACAELKKKNISYYFVVIGGGPEHSNLSDLIRQLGLSSEDIVLKGDTNHDLAIKYYEVADVVLVPSVVRDGVEEATSLSMLEGMAARKVVVVSAIGGMKEVIVNKINGFSFEQGNVGELTKLLIGLKKLTNEERSKIADRGYHDVCEHHHYERHAESYLLEFEKSK